MLFRLSQKLDHHLKSGIQLIVTMIFEERWFQAARSRGLAVEEDEFHGREAKESQGSKNSS